MSDPSGSVDRLWRDAQLAAACVAVAPHELGGIALRASPGPVRDAWLDEFRDLLPRTAPVRKIPLHVSESRLLGGLDLAATLSAGRPVAESGVLAESDGGVVMLAMAERAERSTLAHLTAALDSGTLQLAREGVTGTVPARFGVVALDEGVEDEALSPVLRDRLAFHIDLNPLGIRDLDTQEFSAADVALARQRLPRLLLDEGQYQTLCATALALGVESLRAAQLASRVARVHAALRGAASVDEADLTVAARLVLSPRATQLPPVPEEPAEQPPEEEPPPEDRESPEEQQSSEAPQPDLEQPLEDRILDAAAAAIPAALLAQLEAGRLQQRRAGASHAGRSGQQKRSWRRGRPMGTVAGTPRRGARLSLIATLRAAAPWQGLRRAEQEDREERSVIVRSSDFRVTRFRERTESTIIFAVDASGSAALHRLAEAKGAVELLLNDCYIRRDQVALIAFRGERAELLLPPTRSLVRAKRNLAALPGGGGTPLASAVDAALMLAEQVQRSGGEPSIVMLTDARANITREGKPGRQQAFEEALAAAQRLRIAGVRAMVIDTSPRPHPNAEQLAAEMHGLYVPLPHADAQTLRNTVEAAGR